MAKAKKQANTGPIVAYKGFDANMQCRGFQFAVGETYKHEGPVEACASGFHACEYPLDVLRYYSVNTSKFAVVEQSGTLARHEDDSKVASEVLTVKAAIDPPGLITAAVEFTMGRTKKTGRKTNSGYSGAASNSGYSGAASNSGYSGAASNSGTRGAASNSGIQGVAAGFGYANKVKSSLPGAIFLVRRADDGEITHVFASKVGENDIKPDVWYSLDEAGQHVGVA